MHVHKEHIKGQINLETAHAKPIKKLLHPSYSIPNNEYNFNYRNRPGISLTALSRLASQERH
jgi:hypothetical protein